MANDTVSFQVKLSIAGEDLAQGGLLNIQRGGGMAFCFKAGELVSVDRADWTFLSSHPGPGGTRLFELATAPAVANVPVVNGPVLVGDPPSEQAFPIHVVTGTPPSEPAHLNVAATPEENHGLSPASETK